MIVDDFVPSTRDVTVGIAVSEFNEAITRGLMEGALAALEALGIARVVRLPVPGALELPLAARRLIESGCDAVVALGAVIQGETDHYELVSRLSTSGLMDVQLATGVPVANAVLTVREYAHAVDRSAPGPGNKGAEAAQAAVKMARLAFAG